MILETSKDGKSQAKQHTHFAYVDKSNNGITSVDEKHSHPIIFREPQEAVVDPITEAIIVPESPGGLEIVEADGHTHGIIGPITAVKKDLFKVSTADDEDQNSVQRVKALFKEGRNIEHDSFEDGEEAEKMYEGDQWDALTKTQLEKEQRAAMTINEIEGKIDLLSGIQRQNRFDIRALPNEDGDNRVADILTICIKNAHNNTRFDEQETAAFEDEAIVGRGAFNVDTDFDKDIRGKFVVEKFNWRDFTFGPHERLDAADADYMIKNKWFSFAKIKEMYPDKANEITIDVNALMDKNKLEAGAPDVVTTPEDYDSSKDKTNPADGDTLFVNVSKKQYRLMEAWQKRFAQAFLVMNVVDDFFETLQGWSKEDVNRIKTIEGIDVIPRVIFKFRVTKVAGTVVLEDEFPDIPTIQGEQFCPIVPIYGKKRRNKFWGKVKPVIDLQKENNKRHSQVMDILVRALPYGWFYDEETFALASDEDTWKQDVNKPGWTAKIKDMTRMPQLVQGVKVPVELITAIRDGSEQMKNTMNINSELLGQTGNRQSGVAIRENKRQGLLGNDFLFDNLAFAHRRVGEMTVAHIQKYWGAERIMRVVGFESQNDPELMLGGKPAQEITEDDLLAIARIVEGTDLTTYDIEVAESAYTPTARLGAFLEMKELANQGVPIAPKTLLRMSDMPDKDKAIAELDEFAQQQAQLENRKFQTEITKTQIAKSGDQGGAV